MNNKLLEDAKASGFYVEIKKVFSKSYFDFKGQEGYEYTDITKELAKFAELQQPQWISVDTKKPPFIEGKDYTSECAESEPIHNQLCGCGKPVRYSTHSGRACNKIARCYTREELESKVIELTLQVTKAESEPVAYRQTIHGEHKGKVKIQYGYSEIQIMVSDNPLYAKPQAIDAAIIGEKMTKLELNDKLAELYGIPAYSPIHGLPDTEGYVPISVKLLIDDSARMFELAVSNHLKPEFLGNGTWVQLNGVDHVEVINTDHESPQAAARFAIAMALIRLKEGE